MYKVLIVEDEPGLQITLKDRLISENYDTTIAIDGISGYQEALQNRYDIIILDVMLPGKSGFDVCRDLRSKNIDTPILMLTARGELPDKVVGLKLGADDYLTKPFEMLELLARLEALLRRKQKSGQNSSVENYTFADIQVNIKSSEVKKNNKQIDLSAQEFRLLKFFIENRNATLSREELLKNVWKYEETPTTRTVDVHVSWLRQKLETNVKHPQFFITVHGLGYKFLG